MTNLLVVKITTLASLLVASIFASFAPFVITKLSAWYEARKRRKAGYEASDSVSSGGNANKWFLKFLDLSQGFAGGVLLAGGLLHLIPESNEMIVDILTSWAPKPPAPSNHDDDESNLPWWVNFPWALTCSCLSLMLLYSIEQFANIIVGTAHSHHNHHNHNDKKSNSKKQQQKNNSYQQGGDIEQESLLHHRKSVNNNNNNQVAEYYDGGNHHHDDNHHHHHHHHHHHNDEEEHKSDSHVPKIISAVVLWFSLGAHSVFAGMGLGSEDDEKRMWSLFVAIVSHHLVEAFALGVIMEEAFRKRFIFAFLLLVLYCCATPGGIGIGIAVESLEGGSTVFKLVQALILAVASGAFLHVALLEILVNHKHYDDSPAHSDEEETPAQKKSKQRCDNFLTVLRIGLYFTGFAIMAVLAAFE